MKAQATRETVAGSAYLDLQGIARKNSRPAAELLELYALEGFLARLAASRYADQFVLKGGVLLAAYDARRPTRDIDFTAWQVPGGTDRLLDVMRSVAGALADDGLVFDTAGAKAQQIRDQAPYPGVRVSMKAALLSASLSFHIDITVGDPVWPAPQSIELPRLLGGRIQLAGYPLEMILAEKIRTCVQRDTANTRWRDFADIRSLSRRHDVSGRSLCMTLGKVTAHQHVAQEPLGEVLAGFERIAQPQWSRWRARLSMEDSVPASFADVLAEVTAFADPALTWEADGMTWRALERRWR